MLLLTIQSVIDRDLFVFLFFLFGCMLVLFPGSNKIHRYLADQKVAGTYYEYIAGT